MNENGVIASVYGLLGRLWLKEIDQDLLDSLKSGELAESWNSLCSQVSALNDATIDSLAIEYCELFVGPSPKLPPYQSIWEEGQFGGQAVPSMDRYIDLVDPALRDWGNTITDHLGVQLSMMGLFVAVEQEPDITNSIDLTEAAELAREFFATHLTWARRFLEQARDVSTAGFYAELIELTQSLLESEHEMRFA